MTVILSGARSKSAVTQEIRQMKAAGRKIRASAKSAHAYLVKQGFLTKGGKLSRNYR